MWTDFLTVDIAAVDKPGRPVLPAFDWRSGIPRWSRSRRAASALGRQPLTIDFVVEPGKTASLPPGTYSVKAAYDTRRGGRGGWQGRLEASPYRFTVAAPSSPAEKSEVLTEQARFAASNEDAQSAHGLAQQAVRLAPANRQAWLVLGDASARLGSCGEAVAALEKYLDLCGVPRTYPHPKPSPGMTKEEFYHAYFGGPKEQRNPEHEAIRRRIYLLRWRMQREARNRALPQ